MNKTSKKSSKPFPNKKLLTIIVVIIFILSLLAGFASGYLPYSFAYVKCMHAPVIGSSFLKKTYVTPGEEGYTPDIFSDYFCTEQDAQNANYQHSILTSRGSAEDQKRREIADKEREFSPDKVDFKVYVPKAITYTMGNFEISPTNNNSKQVLFRLSKNWQVIANVREGKVPDGYEVCTVAEYSCEIVGNDSSGRPIKKQVANDDIVSYGLERDGVYINLEGTQNLTNDDVILIYDSLAVYGAL